MLDVSSVEWHSILLDKVFVCITSCAYFIFYSTPKKNKLHSFLGVFIFYPALVAESLCSLLIAKGNENVYPFFVLSVAIVALWPLQYSGFYNRKRFDSQFLCYFTNSLNPFLYISTILYRFIRDRYEIPVYSIEGVLLDRCLLLIGTLLFVPVVKKFIVPKLPKIPRFLVKGLVIAVPVSQIFPMMTNGVHNEIFNSWMFYVIFLAFGITMCVAGYVIYKYAGERSEREKLELAMRFEKDKKNYFDVIEQHSQKISKMSHDISNHLRTIQILAQNKENAELTEYSENLLSEYSNSLKSYCKNPTINAMLLYYNSVATNERVSYKAQANVEKEIKISQVDLVSIISNMLNNAFEACSTLKDEDKEVEITIDTKNNAFVCVCKNKFDGKITKKDRKFYTRKKDEENHGLGIEIIQETVKRLNGKCDFEYMQQSFTVTVYIPM